MVGLLIDIFMSKKTRIVELHSSNTEVIQKWCKFDTVGCERLKSKDDFRYMLLLSAKYDKHTLWFGHEIREQRQLDLLKRIR